MRHGIILFLSIIILLFTAPAAYGIDMRVLLDEESNNITLLANQGNFNILNSGTGLSMQKLIPGCEVRLNKSGGVINVLVNGKEIGLASQGVIIQAQEDNCVFTYKGIKYRGSLQALTGNAGLMPINIIDIEKYLYGVVGKEIGYSTESEALKAQAVASRSFALANRQSLAKYDVKNTAGSQVYGGYSAEILAGGANIVAAVNATAGEVLYYRNSSGGDLKLLPGYFHANSGGHTENIENIWGGGGLPIKGVPSPHDAYAVAFSNSTGQSWAKDQYQWEVCYTPGELAKLAAKYSGQDIGVFKEIKTSDENSVSSRLTSVEIIGTKGSVKAAKDSIRSLLGGLKSTLIEIADNQNVWMKDSMGNLYKGENPAALKVIGADGKVCGINESSSLYYAADAAGTVKLNKEAANSIIIYGRGNGHGVGMSQWGARGMAKEGYTYKEILNHYYTGGDKNIFLGTI